MGQARVERPQGPENSDENQASCGLKAGRGVTDNKMAHEAAGTAGSVRAGKIVPEGKADREDSR